MGPPNPVSGRAFITNVTLCRHSISPADVELSREGSASRMRSRNDFFRRGGDLSRRDKLKIARRFSAGFENTL
jgi:hypothetical protein